MPRIHSRVTKSTVEQSLDLSGAVEIVETGETGASQNLKGILIALGRAVCLLFVSSSLSSLSSLSEPSICSILSTSDNL